jgi:hypothetical protein
MLLAKCQIQQHAYPKYSHSLKGGNLLVIDFFQQCSNFLVTLQVHTVIDLGISQCRQKKCFLQVLRYYRLIVLLSHQQQQHAS